MFRALIPKTQWLVIPTLILGFVLAGCRGITQSAPSQAVPTNSPVQYIVVVVMKLHSFDNLFGTFPGANGIRPGEPGFTQTDASGNSVSPFLSTDTNPPDQLHSFGDYVQEWDGGKMDKFALVNGDQAMSHFDNTVGNFGVLWSLAQQFSLADNYFDSSQGAAQSDVMYLIAANDNNMPQTVFPFYGPCNTSSSTPPFTFPNVGDQLNAKGIDWGWFHEQYGNCGNYVSQENPFQFFTSTQNSSHLADTDLFFQRMQEGTLPPVSFVQPAPGHSTHPGSGDETLGVQWLQQLITQAQASPEWPHMAIVVLWDEGIGYWDHVPPPVVGGQQLGSRVPMMVISPFAKQHYISHVQMDHVSVLRFIQWNWGLPFLNPRNAVGGNTIELRDMFTF
jgi:phospholipase C